MVRVKKRHILFKLINTNFDKHGLNLSTGDIYVSIRNAVSNLYGVTGSKYMQMFSCKYLNIYTGIGYFTCLHTGERGFREFSFFLVDIIRD